MLIYAVCKEPINEGKYGVQLAFEGLNFKQRINLSIDEAYELMGYIQKSIYDATKNNNQIENNTIKINDNVHDFRINSEKENGINL